MPNSAKIKFNEIDQSFFIDSLLKGTSAVSVRTLRGPFGHDDEIMVNWTEFQKKYGGEVEGLEGPTLVKRAFLRGAQLRINKVGHYTDIADPNTLDAAKATFPSTLGEESGDAYFGLTLKYAGVDYNNVIALITLASNGDTDAFNLEIQHLNSPGINEKYENLKIPLMPDVANSHYLDDVISKSKIVNVTYFDASGFTAPLLPDTGTFSATGGSDGGVGAVAQVDTLTLAGTSGTATIAGPGGLTLVATFDTDLTTTAANFVTANQAAYLTQGIILTSAVADLVFTANVAGVPHVNPTGVNATADLVGTNVITTPNTVGGPIAADWSGDAGGTGPYAFDNFDDFEVIAPLDNSDTSVLAAYATYTKNREDCVAFLHLDNSNTTVAALQAAKDAAAVDTRYAYFIAGGLKIDNPFLDTDTPYEISELGDAIGAAMRSSVEFGEWYSFAGTQRGVIDSALGIVNNFAPGGSSKLDQLAQRQINAVVNKNGRNFIKGNFSGQLDSSRKSFINVVKLLIFIKKSLQPSIERYLEQPNDFRTFAEMYNEVTPFLNDLASKEKRALVEYAWRGDQFANTDADLSVNNRADLDQGKYVVELYLKEIVSLQEVTINIISTPSGVSFEDNLN